jgi:hypothetical protein
MMQAVSYRWRRGAILTTIALDVITVLGLRRLFRRRR